MTDKTQQVGQEPIVEVIHFADPWCWWSWGLEPVISRLKEVYGDQARVVYRMGGVAHEVGEWRKEYGVVEDDALRSWISESSELTGMPADRDYYLKSGAKSTFPACIAFKAAQLQGEELAEAFLRRLTEAIVLESQNGSDERVYLRIAKQVGLDAERLKSDARSKRVRDSFEHEKGEMNASFLTLVYHNLRTGKSLAVENVFESKHHQEALEKVAGRDLVQSTPVDILGYFERHPGSTIFPKELGEVFGASASDIADRMKTLVAGGLVDEVRFPFGAVGWRWAKKAARPEMTMEQVKAAHVGTATQEPSAEKMGEIITNAVKGLYTQVATNPHKEYHFPLGRQALVFVGYPKDIEKLPESALESFAGVGYPHAAKAITEGDTVLDIGSGSGTDVLFASIRVGARGKVFGLDITDAMIEKARANIEKMGAKNVKILKGNATQIPLEDASVDVVTSNGVLNLVPEKARAFQEIYRVLKRGGRIQIADIVVQSNVQKVCGLIPQLWADCIGGAAVEKEYLKVMREAGFKDAKVIRRIDYFSHSPSENTKRLTKSFGAESVVISGTKPR